MGCLYCLIEGVWRKMKRRKLVSALFFTALLVLSGCGTGPKNGSWGDSCIRGCI
jgi:hypothetical protein